MNFLFVGNGSYQNRGCEAIVRGTMEILRREFGADIHAEAGVYDSEEIVFRQNQNELDVEVHSFSITGAGPRLSRKWWASQANRRLGCSFSPQCWDLQSLLKNTAVALELGGDNYSLDYGKPERFIEMDRFIQRRGIPVVLWGASVGPFEGDAKFASRMFAHLRGLAAIFVRETESLEYLRVQGVVQNVHLVADPAFLMPPLEVPRERLGFSLPENAIGINLSPLIANYRRPQCASEGAGSAKLDDWLRACVKMVAAVAEELGRPILLVPHVASHFIENDDWALLEALYQQLSAPFGNALYVLPRGLNAQEIKWVIARCSIFAGARTHSTIAALSSGIPTLSIGYSLKARGINRDIFGHLDYCLEVAHLKPETLLEKLHLLIQRKASIHSHLVTKIPELQSLAFKAGPLTKKLLA